MEKWLGWDEAQFSSTWDFWGTYTGRQTGGDELLRDMEGSFLGVGLLVCWVGVLKYTYVGFV